MRFSVLYSELGVQSALWGMLKWLKFQRRVRWFQFRWHISSFCPIFLDDKTSIVCIQQSNMKKKKKLRSSQDVHNWLPISFVGQLSRLCLDCRSVPFTNWQNIYRYRCLRENLSEWQDMIGFLCTISHWVAHLTLSKIVIYVLDQMGFSSFSMLSHQLTYLLSFELNPMSNLIFNFTTVSPWRIARLPCKL